MPTPIKNESEKSFLNRCIPIVLNEGTTKNNKQAVAICSSMYKQNKKKFSKSHLLDSFVEAILKHTNEKN